MKVDNPLIQEAIDTFPNSETSTEALASLEEKTFKEITEFGKQLNNKLTDLSKQFEKLTTKYITVKELRRVAPVIPLKIRG
jgi:hypothetical protein